MTVSGTARPRALAGLLCLAVLSMTGCASLSDKDLEQVDRRDAVLTTEVKGALIGSSDVSAAAIRVELEAGTLVLSGFVASEQELEAAQRVAERAAPGQPIDNRLEVR